jgi:adenylate kinase family enzyme
MTGSDPVLIVTGPPGAGKTTAARLIAGSRERSVHVESDRFFDFIASGFVEPWRPESRVQNEVVMRVVAEAAARYAHAGYFTVIDGIVIPRFFLEPLRTRLADQGHAVAYAVLRPSLQSCIARATARASSPLADPAVIDQLWHEFADLDALERHVIDDDELSPERTAAALAERLRDGALLIA